MKSTLSFLLAALAATSAFAADPPTVQIAHQGRLIDASDVAVEGLHKLHFTLWASPVPLPSESPLWDESYDLTLTKGFYAQLIGAQVSGKKSMPVSLFQAAAPLFLTVAVDQGPELLPRMGIGTVPRAALAESALVASDVKCTGCIDAEELSFNPSLVDGAVTRAKIAAKAVGSNELDVGVVGTSHLAALAITTEKLADAAVKAGKIEAGAVGSAQLAAGAVGADQLAAGAVKSSKIEAGAVGTDQLAAAAVKLGKIDSGAVGTDQIVDGAVKAAKLDAGAVTLAKLDPAMLGHTSGGTGINADMLDGKHASDFLTAATKVDASTVGGVHLAAGSTTNGQTVSLAGKGFTAPPQIFFGTSATAIPIASAVSTTSFRVDLLGSFTIWGCSNDTMFLYNESGTVLQSFDPPDTNTSGVAYDSSDGTLWLVTQNTNHLNHVRTDGTPIGSSITLANADSIAYDASDDSLWYTTSSDNVVRHITKAASSIGTIAVAGTTALRGVTLDPSDNTIWTLDETLAKVVHVSRTGSALAGGFSLPNTNFVGIAKHRDGTFWLGDQTGAPNGKLWHLSATGATIASFAEGLNANFRGVTIVDAPAQAIRWFAIGP